MVTAAIILVLVVLAIKLGYDYNLLKKELPVDHKKEWKMMAIGCIPSILLLSFGVHGFSKNAFFSLPFSASAIAFFIWLMFDGIYNKLRNLSWWYTGTDDPGDASTDNFLQKLKLWQHIAVKVGGFVVSSVLLAIV